VRQTPSISFADTALTGVDRDFTGVEITVGKRLHPGLLVGGVECRRGADVTRDGLAARDRERRT